MKKFAITGNIAAGKSTVSKIIQDMGLPFLSTDEAAHEVLKQSSVIKALSKHNILDQSGQIDRRKLGKLAFTNPAVKSELEAITHPKIFKKIEEFFTRHQTESMVFVEIPLLFEVGAEAQFDIIILVYADDEIRQTRLINRNGCSRADAAARIASQLSQISKVPKSTHVIYNNDNDLKNLRDQIYAILTIY